ncbi:type IV secretory system conjugative DNA transfer family protein [Acidisoma silvae]|uniref:Type IV secretory system conjugative DNA transfer family protein n=1 Tax=Acidisoma silvae TaxID=2802396 RepID=A0A964E1K9_9PROT|nr:type IV secretory system conjugative DNA transfer family protein [Acidisoma silvae]MCB8878476.1 type IV secretory system conjugative DNA transfer family protein [Acidisoma silvae]
MRTLLSLALVLLLGSWVSAHADSLADVERPSSSIPGCLNDWAVPNLPDGTHTCEGTAVAQIWKERAASVASASDVVTGASRDPNRTDKQAVIDALNVLAASADVIAATYHPQASDENRFADMLAWMRQRFQDFQLPIPASLGDGFRILQKRLADPRLLIVDRNAVYDRGAMMVAAFNEAVVETSDSIAPETDAAVFRAHQAAVAGAQAADEGKIDTDAASTAIAKAAGPDDAGIAETQSDILQASIAAHPNQSHYLPRTWRRLSAIPSGLLGLVVVCAVFMLFSLKRNTATYGFRHALGYSLVIVVAAAISWLVAFLPFAVGIFPNGIWVAVVWLMLFVILLFGWRRFVPAWVKASFMGQGSSTHGTAHFSAVKEATDRNHLAPGAPSDAFALGWLHGTGKLADGRFRQDGHILTCAPTGAGKGIGAVIPNLLDYPGSAFVLDFKGENYAVTAGARRAAGQDVFLIDPFGITGAPSHGMNWLDALDPEDPDVVALAGAMAEMLIAPTSKETDPHWTETARELVRGLLIYVAGLPPERRCMNELRTILTGSEDDWAETLAHMLDDPLRGHRIVARTATAHLNRPERERASVLSTATRHTAWLDDPRLAATLSRSDFDLRDLKRRRMTVYIALPPDRLRPSLGFVRGFIGLALNAMTATQGKPEARVAFFLDEFGQLGRMDSLADNITILRGYGAQFWLFVQDLSQLKAVYPRWQSFLANTTQQFFGTADYDTAKYLSDALGQFTVSFTTSGSSTSTGYGQHGGSVSSNEHVQSRSLMTPDEVMRLGPEQPIVMISREAPYLLFRLNYLTDAPYAGKFDPNPMHLAKAGE